MLAPANCQEKHAGDENAEFERAWLLDFYQELYFDPGDIVLLQTPPTSTS